MVVIKRFSDNSQLEYDQGKFDYWCVYLRSAPPQDYQRIAPRDADYFRDLQQLAEVHGADKIYQDFVRLYNATSAELEQRIIDGISILTRPYEQDALQMDKLFTILYAGMVAEENKQYAKLKKRIKRLGMHQVLVEKLAPAYAANFSRNKPWRDLAKVCEQRGF